MTDVTQGNQTELRTAEGTIQDQVKPDQTKDTTGDQKPTDQTKPTDSPPPKPVDLSKSDKSPLADDKDKKEEAKGAPEKYEDFKLPEGFTLEAEALAQAHTLFKELGVSQEGAQKLIDFHVKSTQEAFDAPFNHWADMQKEWRDQIAADQTLAPRLPQIKENYSKMLGAMGDPALEKDFREMVEYTGAGNHPSFIKMMDKISAHFSEGKGVQGGKPAPVAEPGKATGTGPNALYPNLK